MGWGRIAGTRITGGVFVLLALVVGGCGKKADKDKKSEAEADKKTQETSIAEAGSYLHLVLPSVIVKDAPIPVRLRVVTHVGLPDYDFEGAFRIEASSAATKFPEDPTLEPQQEGYYEMKGLSFGDTGVQRVRGSVPQDTLVTIANPIVVQENPEWNIYWGDLNGSSDLSTGASAPAVYFWYARNVALLDFAALTDVESDEATSKTLDEKASLEANSAATQVDQPGRFVSLPGFEWTSKEYGNRIALFAEPPTSLPSHARGVDTPEKLRAALPAGSLLLVPHPSGSKHAPSAKVAGVGAAAEDLVEIYSAEGIFEAAGSTRATSEETPGNFVVDLLGAGRRLGFVGTSNTRLSLPGNPRGPSGGEAKWTVGLTAVLAKELSRAAILEALRARRTYATTGPRYLLEFNVDGQQMGSEIRVKKGHVAKVYGSLGSVTNWIKVELVTSEGVLATLTPEGNSRDVVELEATTKPIDRPTFVYLRGTDETGGMAWSSPIYLLPE